MSPTPFGFQPYRSIQELVYRVLPQTAAFWLPYVILYNVMEMALLLV